MQGLITNSKVDRQKISAIIPAYNEETTVGRVMSKALRYVDEVILSSTTEASITYRKKQGMPAPLLSEIL